MNTHIKTILSPVGNLRLESDDSGLTSIQFVGEKIENTLESSQILTETEIQLNDYFSGNRKTFDIPLNPKGTTFQKEVWDYVKKITFGKTASYLDISKQMGSITYTRAVGMANGKNPIPIIIPCHRIIGTNGKLTGYAGGLERKKWLLLHEQKNESHGRLF